MLEMADGKSNSSSNHENAPRNPMGKGVSTMMPPPENLEDEVSGPSGVNAGTATDPSQWTLNKLDDIKKAMEMLNLYPTGPAKTTEEALKKKFDFREI